METGRVRPQFPSIPVRVQFKVTLITPEDIGSRIRETRQALNISQIQLAEGVSLVQFQAALE